MAQKTLVKKAKKGAVKKVIAVKKAAKKPVEVKAAPAKKGAVVKAAAVKAGSKGKAIEVKAPAKPFKRAVSTLTKQDLQYFRGLLLEKRREILGDVGTMESEAFKSASNLSNMPIHMADVGTDNFEQEFTLGLIESERQILREIQEALARIDEGSFGICQGTNKPIPRVRLEAVPWAKFTIEYSRLLESGKLQRDNGKDEEEGGGGGGGGGGDEDEE